MEGKNQLGGFLQAMSLIYPASVITYSFDCVDFDNIGDVEKSIKKYFCDHWYDFGFPPDEWSKYPGDSFKKEIENKKFHFEVVNNWKHQVEECLNSWFPEIYSKNPLNSNDGLIKITTMPRYFMAMINDEFYDKDIDEDEIEVFKFKVEDYDFLRHYFTWMIYETFIIVTKKKIYIIYVGQDD
jgi:hypothetical protein